MSGSNKSEELKIERRRGCLFKTERCTLSIFRQSDYGDAEKIFANSRVRAFLGGIREPKSVAASLENMANPEEGSYYWIVRDKRSKEFIGLVSLDAHHDEQGKEVSYQLLPEWWERGYATEAVAKIIDYALSELNLPAIVAETQSANTASCRILEKLGMKLERKVIRFGAEQAIYAIRRS